MSFFRKLFTRSGPKQEQEAPPPAPEEAAPTPEPAAEQPQPEPEPASIMEVAAPAPEPERRSGWFSRLSEGLSKSSRSITGSITSIFTKKKLDQATLNDLEDALIQADLGVSVAALLGEGQQREKVQARARVGGHKGQGGSGE